LVWGFLADEATAVESIDVAVTATADALASLADRGDADAPRRYVGLTDTDKDATPSRRLDDLATEEYLRRRPVLIKCDVEGAELLVLRGAESFIRRAAPVLALSIHPPALPDYGHTKLDIEAFLRSLQ